MKQVPRLQVIRCLLALSVIVSSIVAANSARDIDNAKSPIATYVQKLRSFVSTSTRNLNNVAADGIDIARKVQVEPQLLTPAVASVPKINEPFTLRINAGSAEAFIDHDSLIWKSDSAFINTGDIYSVCPLEIINTTLDDLYCKERYFNKWVHINKPFRYEVPVTLAPDSRNSTTSIHERSHNY